MSYNAQGKSPLIVIFFMYVYECLLVHVETRMHQIRWNWSHPWLRAAPCGYWDWNLGLLQKQKLLLTNDPSLQPQSSPFYKAISHIMLGFTLMTSLYFHELFNHSISSDSDGR